MKLLHSGLWFGVVGLAAAATHGGVFALTRHWMLPELANAVGFCVGFFVSFGGHRWLTFSDTGASIQRSLVRFVATAALGFVANEAVFVALFRWAAWPAWLALVAAMGAAAVQTFVLGRFWAFHR